MYMREYTELSQHFFDEATSVDLDPSDAAQWILCAQQFRTLSDKLLRFYDGTAEEMKALLRRELSILNPDPKEKEAIRKNVGNWFSDKSVIDDRKLSRRYAFDICFILKLSRDRANEFMKLTTGEGIHYRNTEEFLLAYALDKGMSRGQADELTERMLDFLAQLPEEGNTVDDYTQTYYQALTTLDSEAELQDYLLEHRAGFSRYHYTAYRNFTDMMNVLQSEGTDASVRELVEQNLFRRLVMRNGKLSPLEKSIRSGWPEETQLSKMKTQEEPVTRKVLILLFLASGGGLSVQSNIDDEWNEDENADSPDADFEKFRVDLDAMLTESGFAKLDPRSPFDWMVLFGIATGDMFDLDERMESLLHNIFGSEDQEEENDRI